MARETWLTSQEATIILRKNSGREDISADYIRQLARLGKVRTRKYDGRTRQYLKADVEGYVVREVPKPKRKQE